MKQNRMSEESLSLINTFVLRHRSAHKKCDLSHIKKYERLFHVSISTSNRDSIHLLHTSVVGSLKLSNSFAGCLNEFDMERINRTEKRVNCL